MIASAFTALAMTLSLGEAVLASTCSPDMDAPGGAVAESHAPLGMPCCEPAPATGSEHDGGDQAPCPFGPAAGAAGCATAASLPAHTFGALAASPESTLGLLSADTQQSLSFATALFHPPKS